MADRVYKKITVTGCSEESYEKAIRVAVSKAAESIRGMAWFEVGEMRGGIREDGIIEFQVTVEVAFKVD
jgi:flavin-binding protein dodecin